MTAVWQRRLLGHLTTPLLVALLLAVLLADEENGFLATLWATSLVSYLGWLALGFPGMLFRRRRPVRLWEYAGLGALFGGLPGLFFSPGLGAAAASIAVGAAAGAWYWLCAHWRVPPPAAADPGR